MYGRYGFLWIITWLTPFSPDNCVDPEKLRCTWWESFAMMAIVLHLQRLLTPLWYFNPVLTFHFWAVLVVWQHTLSCFAEFHKGVWMVCKAAGADGHQRLYPWFPQQDTASVVSWSILLTNWWHLGTLAGLWVHNGSGPFLVSPWQRHRA